MNEIPAIDDIRVNDGALARRLNSLRSQLDINLPEHGYGFDAAQTGQEIRVRLIFQPFVSERMQDHFRGRLAWILESEEYTALRGDLGKFDGVIYVEKCKPVEKEAVRACSIPRNSSSPTLNDTIYDFKVPFC